MDLADPVVQKTDQSKAGSIISMDRSIVTPSEAKSGNFSTVPSQAPSVMKLYSPEQTDTSAPTTIPKIPENSLVAFLEQLKTETYKELFGLSKSYFERKQAKNHIRRVDDIAENLETYMVKMETQLHEIQDFTDRLRDGHLIGIFLKKTDI